MTSSTLRSMPNGITSYFENMCDREKALTWIATISRDGTPHVAPTCFVKAVDDKRIAIGCVFLKQTVKNLELNNAISLGSAKFTEGYDGYMVKGKAQVFDSGEEFDTFKEEIFSSSKGRRTIKWMIIVTVENVYSLRPFEGRKRIV